MRSWALIPTVLLAGCAVGITPPEDTPMVLIDEGLTFQFGSEAPCDTKAPETNICTEENPDASLHERQLTNLHPRVWVKLKPFYMDQHEVTNIQYEFCEAMGACPKHNIVNAQASSQAKYHLTDEFDRFPVVQVTFEQAEAYCEFVGKRLPNEFEWERVARGNGEMGQDRAFPVEGLEYGGDLLNCKLEELPTAYCRNQELESVPTGAVLAGGGIGPADHVIDKRKNGEDSAPIYHMFGNAAEWTSSYHSENVTCEPDVEPDCTPCWACGKVESQEKDACLEACAVCENCPSEKDGCGYLCQDDGVNALFACKSRTSSKEAPLTPIELNPQTAAKRVIRGGSVLDGTGRACLLRSGARDRVTESSSLTPDRPQTFVGFRCVKDAE